MTVEELRSMRDALIQSVRVVTTFCGYPPDAPSRSLRARGIILHVARFVTYWVKTAGPAILGAELGEALVWTATGSKELEAVCVWTTPTLEALGAVAESVDHECEKTDDLLSRHRTGHDAVVMISTGLDMYIEAMQSMDRYLRPADDLTPL